MSDEGSGLRRKKTEAAQDDSMANLFVRPGVWIDRSELRFSFSRSGGPGGQNVNKLNTKVTLRFNVADSASLTESQRKRILLRLNTRINDEGVLQIMSSENRSQSANRRAAIDRLCDMLATALAPVRRRVKTKVPQRSKKRRMAEKDRRGQTKSLRKRPGHDE